MLDLSPVKILIVLIVAMILLGPDKLPQVARQLGAGWGRLREFHERMDREIRQNIPDLPSTAEIVHFARSPVALLEQLAQMPSQSPDEPLEDPGMTPALEATSWPEDPSGDLAGQPQGAEDRIDSAVHVPAAAELSEPDDPSMN